MKYNKLSVALSAIFALALVSCTNEPTTPPAKERPVSKPDSIYVYNLDASGNETLAQKTYFSYDAAKNNTVIYNQYFTADGRISGYDKTNMQYTGKGLMAVKSESKYDMTNRYWRVSLYQEYSYNANNKLDSIYQYYSSEPLPPNPVPDKKWFYSWTDDTHAEILVYNNHYRGQPDPWLLSYRILESFTDFGEIETYTWYWLTGVQNPDGTPSGQQELTYDSFGNPVYVTSYTDGKFESRLYNKYEYDELGNILVKWCCNNTGGGDTGPFNSKSVYYY